LYNGLLKTLGGYLYTYLYPLLRGDEVSGKLWHPIGAIHDEGLTL